MLGRPEARLGRLCIVQHKPATQSESFIRAHLERLPAQVRRLQVQGLPQLIDDEHALLDGGRLGRAARAVRSRLGGVSRARMAHEATVSFFRSAGIDAVLAEYGMNGVAVMDACREADVPLVVHFHGHDAFRRSILEGVGRRYPEMFEKAAAIVVVSEAMRRQVLNLGAPPEKVHLNVYGVDVERFAVTDAGANDPRVLAVGRFVDKKAPHLTLEAFRRARQHCPAARLRMVGDGYLLDSCRRLAKATGLGSCVEFPGNQPHDAVAREMQSARMLVQHSVTADDGDSEGTPNAILEAGACGLPVVSTRHAGIPDVVEEGVTGFLVDENDVAGMAEAMVRLLDDAELATRMGDAAQAHVRRERSMDKSIAGLWSIIESAMGAAAT